MKYGPPSFSQCSQLPCSVDVLLVTGTTEVDLSEGLVVWKDVDYLQRGKKYRFLNRNSIAVSGVRCNLALSSRFSVGQGIHL